MPSLPAGGEMMPTPDDNDLPDHVRKAQEKMAKETGTFWYEWYAKRGTLPMQNIPFDLRSEEVNAEPRKLSMTFTELHRCGIYVTFTGQDVVVWPCEERFEGSKHPEGWDYASVPVGYPGERLPAHIADCCPLHARADVQKALLVLWDLRRHRTMVCNECAGTGETGPECDCHDPAYLEGDGTLKCWGGHQSCPDCGGTGYYPRREEDDAA